MKMIKKKVEDFEFDPSKWIELASERTPDAISVLPNMVKTKIKITSLNLRLIPTSEVMSLVCESGQKMVTVRLGTGTETADHVMLVYPKQIACGLIDMIMGNAHGTTSELHNMELALLAGIGDITGTCFRNTLADNTDFCLISVPPFAVGETARVILDATIPDIIHYSDYMVALGMIFHIGARSTSGTIVFLPNKRLMDVMMQHNGKSARVQ